MAESRFQRRSPAFPIIVGLIVLYVALSALLFAVFSGARSRNLLLQQYQLEQWLAQLITSIPFSQDGGFEFPDADSPIEIVAFGVYDQTGQHIVIHGSAPPVLVLDTDHPRERLIVQSADRDRLIYIRKIFAQAPLPQTPGTYDPLSRTDRARNPFEWFFTEQRPAAMYLEADKPPHFSQWVFSWPVYAALEALLALVFILIGHTYTKNQGYRRRLLEQQNLVTLGEAARTISHEIKNPLSAISLRLEILGEQIPDAAGEDLGIIRQEVERLNRLASKIGEFLKNPAGTPERVELYGFLEDLTRRFVPQVEISVEPAPENAEAVFVEIDRDHLRSIAENVLVNARESGAPGPILVKIARRKRLVSLSIIDDGPGIDPSLGDSVFRPFVTSKARGSGFGLAIARRFAEAAHGSLTWKPNPAGGTIMILTLPEAP